MTGAVIADWIPPIMCEGGERFSIRGRPGLVETAIGARMPFV